MTLKLTINVDKAKEVVKNFIRVARAAKFEEADLEFMRAVESDDAAAKYAASEKKQKLRDATKTDALLNATTVDEVKNSWDHQLLGDAPFSYYEKT